MNESTLNDLSLKFKSHNNSMRSASVCSLKSTIEVIKTQFEGADDNVTFGIVDDVSDYKDPLTKMPVAIRNGKYDQCHYVMIDLDRVRDITGFSELISSLKDDAYESENVNNLFIGYRSARLVKKDLTTFKDIKGLIKTTKDSKRAKKLA